ncbi:MAG: archaeosine biosynthesis radical SAM protein RaSEA [Candidatus Kariarchaeaceae archaeon]|jgi:radical SAM enzyme (TIGR01210 family)
MRADPTKEKSFTTELYRLRVLSNEMRKQEMTRIINWMDRYPSLEGEEAMAIVFILPTKGCKYALAKHGGCSMCTLPMDNPLAPTDESINALPERVWQIFQEKGGSEKFSAVKFYTSGSFLDRWELPKPVRNELLLKFAPAVEEITIETRCEFVTKKNLQSLPDLYPAKLIVAIGQESTDDEINRRSINKGHTLKQFKRAVEIVHHFGMEVKGYILLKPVFMSELSAIEDAIRSAQDMKLLNVKNVSLNPCYIGKATLMDQMFKSGTYQPPWLWSVVEVSIAIKRILGDKVRVISDPVAAGSNRGPSNCGSCEERFRDALKTFSANQNLSILTNLHCECKMVYRSMVHTEHLSSGMGIGQIFTSRY